eukprot:1677770-Pleurochrysis_carterae.AAC.1
MCLSTKLPESHVSQCSDCPYLLYLRFTYIAYSYRSGSSPLQATLDVAELSQSHLSDTQQIAFRQSLLSSGARVILLSPIILRAAPQLLKRLGGKSLTFELFMQPGGSVSCAAPLFFLLGKRRNLPVALKLTESLLSTCCPSPNIPTLTPQIAMLLRPACMSHFSVFLPHRSLAKTSYSCRLSAIRV